jgi:hypothetical protein
MNRTGTGLCFAAAIGLAATLGAQSSTTTTASQPAAASDHEVTISGCLSKAAGGYMLTNARVEPNASASTTTAPGATSTTGAATTTAGNPPPTAAGTTGSTTTTAGAAGTAGEAAAAASPAMTWMLSGDNDLEKHVGHRIQVTGKTSWNASMDRGRTSTTDPSGVGTTAAPPSATTSTATSTSTSTTTASGSADHPRMDVKSIKMVSTSCS